MEHRYFVLFLLIGFLCFLPSGLSKEMEAQNGVLLQVLDKVLARVSSMMVRVGDVVQFSTLRIRVRACYESVPIEEPESAAFLEIIEVRPRPEEEIIRFSGWMFSSSPSLSFLEHPVYDVWVVRCIDVSSGVSEERGHSGLETK